MKVIRKSEYTDSTNPLYFVLKNRGLSEEDIEKVLNPTEDLLPDWTKLDNIYEGVELLNEHIEQGSKIGIMLDEDYDGISSASIMYKYLTKQIKYNNDKVKVILHSKRKAHGIDLVAVKEVLSGGDLLICPDSSSSDFEEHKYLDSLGINILVIDHHLADIQKTPAIIINNQLSDKFQNKSLTGSAMTYLFCLAYSEKGYPKPYDLIDLCASGLVADRADFSKDLGAYYLMREGLKQKNIKSQFLDMFRIKDKSLADRNLSAKDIGFSVAPLINAVFRMGTPEEVELLMEGVCEFDKTVFNTRKKMDISIVESAYLKSKSVKARQKKTEEKVLEAINDRIKLMGANDYKVLLVNSTDIIEDNGINGLVAIKLANEYKKPVLVMKVVGDELKGSGRNFNNSPIDSLKDLLESTGKFTCQGHDNAFGVSINIEDAMAIQQELEDLLKEVDLNNATHEVDFEWNGYADTDTIITLANNADIWCNGIDEPLIHIKDKVINKDDIRFMGKTGRSIKIDIQGVDCVKFNLHESEIHELTTVDSKFVKLNLVCTATVNNFNGMEKPQLIIKDFTVESVEGKLNTKLSLDALPF